MRRSLPAVVRVGADRDRRAAVRARRPRRSRTRARAGADRRRRFAVGNPSVPPRASPATTSPSTSAGRPSSRAARSTSPARSELADPARRDALDERDGAHVEAERRASSSRSPARAVPEAEVPLRRRRPRRRSAAAPRSTNSSGSSRASSRSNSTTSASSMPALREQLEPPLERRRAARPRSRARSRGCGSKVTTVDDEAGRLDGVEHAPVAEVDAVEGADRDGALLRPAAGLARLHRQPFRSRHERAAVDDDLVLAPRRPADRAAPRRPASGRKGGSTGERSASIAPRRKGPTSVRRSVAAVAAERVRDRAHVGAGADAQVEPGDASLVASRLAASRTRERRSGISTSTPRRCEPVGALAADLDGRGRRHAQLDLPSQRRDRGLELRPRQAARAARASRPRGRRSTCARRRSISVR